MFIEDSDIRVIRADWVESLHGRQQRAGDPNTPITASRWAEYRRKFKELELSGGVTKAPGRECEVYFNTFGSGNVVAGQTKGFAYCDSIPSPIVVDLDRESTRPKTITFRVLQDHWYLFYEFE